MRDTLSERLHWSDKNMPEPSLDPPEDRPRNSRWPWEAGLHYWDDDELEREDYD